MLKEIQEVLKASGLYGGAIDSKIGISTLTAIDAMPKSVAKTVQEILKAGGVYKGVIDGLFGPASYQAFNGLIPAPQISAIALRKIYPTANTQYLQYINAMAKDWGIQTKAEMCLFLANILVESEGFNDKDLRENFNYKPENLYKTFKKYIASEDDARKLLAKGPEAVANRVYGGRLGNKKPDDGWRFRGGGLIQTTGRYNFSMLAKAIKEDLLNFPNRIAEPAIATKAALYFWSSKNCGYYANRMQVEACRRLINGGTNGLKEVQNYFLKAWAVLF